jgi:basic membrane lipoprotein Med (substrate-binding protein (PBP1-ABC) superfamily)
VDFLSPPWELVVVDSAFRRAWRTARRGFTRLSWPWRITSGVLAALLTGLAVWGALLPSSGSGQRGYVYPAARQRSYSTYSACLLTGASGLSDATASQVWAGLEAGSTAVDPAIQVRYTAAIGAGTDAAVTSYVNTMALSKCSLVVAVGAAQTRAAAARAAAFPAVDFLVVGGSPDSAANLATLAPSARATEAAVSAELRRAASGGFKPGAIQ